MYVDLSTKLNTDKPISHKNTIYMKNKRTSVIQTFTVLYTEQPISKNIFKLH